MVPCVLPLSSSLLPAPYRRFRVLRRHHHGSLGVAGLHRMKSSAPTELDRPGLVEALARHAEYGAEDAHVEGGAQEQVTIAVGIPVSRLAFLLWLARTPCLALGRSLRLTDLLQDGVGESVATEQGLAILTEFLLDEDQPRQVFLSPSFGEACQHIVAHVALDADVRQRNTAVVLAEEPPRIAVAHGSRLGMPFFTHFTKRISPVRTDMGEAP